MNINKSELINRLVKITGNTRNEYKEETVPTLLELYEEYVSNGERLYINVPYKEKDVAKLLGARYDGEKKKWYIPPGIDINPFSKWM